MRCSMLVVFMGAFAGCLPELEVVEDPSIRIPGAELADPVLVETLIAVQDGAHVNVTVGLSEPVDGVELRIGVGEHSFFVSSPATTGEATFRLAVDPCEAFGETWSVTATVIGSDDIVAVVVDFDGVVVEVDDVARVDGLVAFCGVDEVTFRVDEPTDYWFASDGTIDLVSDLDGQVSSSAELSIRLAPGTYTATTSGTFVVVSAE